MKKIFNPKSTNHHHQPNEQITTNINQTYSHFIGKTFQLRKHIVCIEEIIAEGGFSVVFLVRSNTNGKRYALKRMYVNSDVDLEACKREIQICKTLSENNKYILKYIDSSIQRQSTDIHEILLLTKYCKLGGLVQLMNDRLNNSPIQRLTEKEIIKIFCDVCQAVADLHEIGIIHRDLKVENILIDDIDNSNNNYDQTNSANSRSHSKDKKLNSQSNNHRELNFVLCDFGSATNQIFDRNKTNNSINVQSYADEIQKYTTLSYRSPEMVDLYSNKPITTKSDIWALGCLLYKLCYYQMPFGESLLAIQEGRFAIPDQKAEFYSKNLNSLINYMLEPDPLKRPDIFQVSFLAFLLAQKPCSVKNINSSEIPNFNELQSPLTESEFKKLSVTKLSVQNSILQSTSQQYKKLQDPGNITSNISNPVTTVNPRERPKANNLNASANPIIPLIPNTNISSQNNFQRVNQQLINLPTNKINFGIKLPDNSIANQAFSPPLYKTQQEQSRPLGFDDDFNSISNPNNEEQQFNNQKSKIQTHNLLAATTSSPIQQISNDYPMQSISEKNNKDQLLQSGQPNSVLSEKKSHRRSASHSSSILLKPQIHDDYTNLNTKNNEIDLDMLNSTQSATQSQQHKCQQILYQRQLQNQYNHYKMFQQQQQHQLMLQNSSNQSYNQNNLLPNNRLLSHVAYHSRSASASPNVSLLNNSMPTSKAAVIEALSSNSLSSSSTSTDKTISHDKVQQSNEAVSTIATRVANASTHQNINTNNPFGDNFTTLNDNELFGLEFDRIRQKNEQNQIEELSDLPANSLINQKTKTIKEVRNSRSNNSSLNRSKSSNPSANSKLSSRNDPFRKAPLKVKNHQMILDNSIQKSNSRSSSNSNSSISISTADDISKSSSAQSSPIKSVVSITYCSDNNVASFLGAVSAFQPYKRPPDPFVSAPFNLVPTETTKPTSSSASITPTDTQNIKNYPKTSSKKNNYQSQYNHDLSSSNRTNDEELIAVIHQVQTPIVAKKNEIKDPFIAAPFTVKKTMQKQSTLNSSGSSTNDQNLIINSANSSSSIKTLTSSFDNSTELNDLTKNIQISDKINLYNKTVNASSYINQNNFSSTHRIPLSHSLHEIKDKPENISNTTSSDIASDLTKQGVTSKLIKHYNLKEQQNHQQQKSFVIKNQSNISTRNEKLTETKTIASKNDNNDSKNLNINNGGHGGIANMSFDDF